MSIAWVSQELFFSTALCSSKLFLRPLLTTFLEAEQFTFSRDRNYSSCRRPILYSQWPTHGFLLLFSTRLFSHSLPRYVRLVASAYPCSYLCLLWAWVTSFRPDLHATCAPAFH